MATPLAEALKRWSEAEQVDIDHALMVIIPTPTEEEVEVLEIEDKLKILGHVNVKQKMLTGDKTAMKVLCESREALDVDKVPSEVSPGEGLDPWTIVIWREPTGAAEDFNSKSVSYTHLRAHET